VRFQELSMAGRMEDATYFDFFAENGMGALEAVGWPIQRMISEGFAIVMRRHRAEFLAPAHLGDELELATWVSKMKRATGTRHYTITRVGDGELLARMVSLGVWVELATLRPIRVPPGLLDDFAPSIAC
jgi:acyl-CoA thioester hydrolase